MPDQPAHRNVKQLFDLTGRVAIITGAGFVDVVHSTPQNGVAPNDIELHPVLSFTHATC